MKANELLLAMLWLISLMACTVSETGPEPVARTQWLSATRPVVDPLPAEVTPPPPTHQPTIQIEGTQSTVPTSTPVPTPFSTAIPSSETAALPDSCALPNVECDEIQLSPDGRYLAYTETKLDEPEGCGLREDFHVINAATLQTIFTQHNARFSIWLPPHQIEIIDVQPLECHATFTLEIVDLVTAGKKSLLEPAGMRGWAPDRTAYFEFGLTNFWIYDFKTEAVILPQAPHGSGPMPYDYSYHTLCWDDTGDHMLFTRHALAEIKNAESENWDLITYEIATTGQREIWRFDRKMETFIPLLVHPDHSYFLTNLRLSPDQFASPISSLWAVYQNGFECEWSGDWVQVIDVLDVPSAPFYSEPLDPLKFIGTAAEQRCGFFGLDCDHSTLLALNIKTGETKPWAELASGPKD